MRIFRALLAMMLLAGVFVGYGSTAVKLAHHAGWSSDCPHSR